MDDDNGLVEHAYGTWYLFTTYCLVLVSYRNGFDTRTK